MDVIPLDATLAKGSQGLLNQIDCLPLISKSIQLRESEWIDAPTSAA
jgi:hypothetical protein